MFAEPQRFQFKDEISLYYLCAINIVFSAVASVDHYFKRFSLFYTDVPASGRTRKHPEFCHHSYHLENGKSVLFSNSSKVPCGEGLTCLIGNATVEGKSHGDTGKLQ